MEENGRRAEDTKEEGMKQEAQLNSVMVTVTEFTVCYITARSSLGTGQRTPAEREGFSLSSLSVSLTLCLYLWHRLSARRFALRKALTRNLTDIIIIIIIIIITIGESRNYRQRSHSIFFAIKQKNRFVIILA